MKISNYEKYVREKEFYKVDQFGTESNIFDISYRDGYYVGHLVTRSNGYHLRNTPGDSI